MVANVNFDKNITGGIPLLDEAGDTITFEFEIEHQDGENLTELRLNDTLLEVMKEAEVLQFAGRYEKLEPVLSDIFAFPVMARVATRRRHGRQPLRKVK